MSVMTRLHRLLVACVLLIGLTAAGGAPKPELLPRWQASGTGFVVEDLAFAAFLARYRSVGANGVARLGYGKVTAADKAALKAYVHMLGAADVDQMTRAQQFAFWVNLYNAATIDLVLDNYPLASITSLKDGLFSFGPWDRKLLKVKGIALSLNDIEHRILRPIFKDPRVHFILNCASMGCPDIGAAPLRAATLDVQLSAARDGFLAHPRGAQMTPKGLQLSSIFYWYGDDFGGPAGVVRYIKAHGPRALGARITADTKIAGHGYDWALNAPA
jgi:Protein of unknown function, DUF547